MGVTNSSYHAACNGTLLACREIAKNGFNLTLIRWQRTPRPAGCIKLAGHDNLWRIRVGDHRIIYEIHDDRRIVIILIVAHRRESYRGL